MNLTEFFKEAYAELGKVTWLSRQEVIASTVVVILFVAAMAIFVGSIDFILSFLLSFVLR